MGILDRIDRIDPTFPKGLLESLRIEDVKAERLRLEREEKQKIAECDNLSAQYKELIKKGSDGGETERRIIVRHMMRLEMKMRVLGLQLKRIAAKIAILDNGIFILENRSMLENRGRWEPRMLRRLLFMKLQETHPPRASLIDAIAEWSDETGSSIHTVLNLALSGLAALWSDETGSSIHTDNEDYHGNEVDDEVLKKSLDIWSMDLCENSSQPLVNTMPEENIEQGKPIGRISHYFKHSEIAVIDLSGVLKVGDVIRIVGGQDTDFTQTIKAMEVEHKKVEEAQKGQSVGFKVEEKVREGYLVYRIASYTD